MPVDARPDRLPDVVLDTAPDRTPDGPCPDLDGDGDPDAVCGGADCNDGNPELSGERSICIDAATTLVCQDGRPASLQCPADAPLCDRRTGECTADACGDGVRHDNEDCDPETPESEPICDAASCTFLPCGSSADCPDYASSCSELRADELFYCRAPVPGAAELGSLCNADIECRSGYCDPTQGRCSEGCDTFSGCGADTYCTAGTIDVGPPRCAYGCFETSECGDGYSCALWFAPPDLRPSRCTLSVGTGSFGAFCSTVGQRGCVSNVCEECIQPCIGRRFCTRVCSSDTECEEPLSSCVLRWKLPSGWSRSMIGTCDLRG